MAKKDVIIPKDGNIIRVPLEEAMPDNYLPYAVEVAKDRALPDVRDGLKPVHRRILYGAYLLKAFPDKPYYKSARIVGDILGKFHPHGDTSVYDAMVIMAQNFSTREQLIDGHGNWGSQDGDGAAAMRYTEARLAPIAMEMINDIDKGVVDMVPNYSDSEMEPKVLPARYPNLLVNGTFGIAVGLATNIPPHNLKEVIDGALAYIDNNDITTKEIMEYIKGPDLPTGGVIIGKKSLISAYETGEGKVTLRSKTSIEKLENGRFGIVITEFPYRRNKAKILQTISEMTGDKRHAKALESIVDIRDESDRTGIRAVIEFKKAADEEIVDKVLKYLFKKTDLQCNVSFNMVALADGKPETMGLKTIITHYVNHRKEVITRRTQKELEVAEKRFHIVEGFIKAIDVLDEIIKTIRASKSKKEAHERLVFDFGFTDIQADAILELMLYRLTGLEIKVFEKEYKELEKLIKGLKKILANEKELFKVVKKELIEVSEKYSTPRRTELVEDDSEAKIDLEELLIVEDIMVTVSNDGFVKRIPLKTYNRLNANADDIEYREGDYLKLLIKSNTKENLMIFTNKGNMYQIKGNTIPEGKWKDKGERIDTLIRGLSLDNEKIVAIHSLELLLPEYSFEFITAKGMIKMTTLDKFITAYSRLMALKLKNEDELIDVKLVKTEGENEFIQVVCENGLQFVTEKPKQEPLERAVLGCELCALNSQNKIVKIESCENFSYAEFTLGINKKGNIKIYEKYSSDTYIKTKTDSNSEILVFTNKGKVFKFQSLMVQNITEGHLKDLVDNLDADEEVLNIKSIKDKDFDGTVYFFSKKGYVKKTALQEFCGIYNNQIAYKFKMDTDILVSVDFNNSDNSQIVVVTKKAMAIKFAVETVSLMGKIASGVTAISLKDNDEVIFGKIISVVVERNCEDNYNEIAVSYEECSRIILISKLKQKYEFLLRDMKLQNRAGRGLSLAILEGEDYIKETVIK
ncbi:DNA topoisomerase IV subunit A [Clostridium cavendishii DSM 21758]|uniref:DNA topoisomerase (ATP-hydrolyzing) n=1 Tax=Clostridium cavendishii DSM 21758 TaxID=1121302 RepID=A0A1M6B7C0_9CLOT|nr:DNA topoisomerase IV subunit A [Clostridium cavendishii]SHI44616.1 DNA topoisomerase IV subunit A [Clostridium cavendishii DSM 21758]